LRFLVWEALHQLSLAALWCNAPGTTEKVEGKICQLGNVRIKNVPGFLIAALKNDYTVVPSQPTKQRTRYGSGSKSKGCDRGNEEEIKKKEFIKSLYLS